MSWLTDPWTTGLVARAGIALVIVGALGGVIGVFVVVRGLPFTIEAFSHTMFPGAVIAAAAGGPLIVGALVAGAVAAGGMALASRSSRTPDETAVGVVFTGMFALGALLVAALGPLKQDVTSFLFGSLLGVTATDVAVSAAVAAAILVVLIALRRPLVSAAFDRDGAAGDGVRVDRLELVMLALVALAVVVCVRAIGNVLVLALFVTPAASARLLCKRLATTVAVSVAIGVLSGLGGLYISYHGGVAVGGAVVLVATGLFALSWLLSPRAGLPAHARRMRAVQPARP